MPHEAVTPKGVRRAGGAHLVVALLMLMALLSLDLIGRGVFHQALLAPLQEAMAMWDDTYQVERMSLEHGVDDAVEVTVSLAHCLALQDRAVCPGAVKGLAQVTTPVGTVDLVGIALVSGVVAWPVRRRAEYGYRLLLLAPTLLTIWMLDLPLVILGALWRLHHDFYQPDAWSALLAWVAALQDGARWVLVGLGVWVVVTLSSWINKVSN
ncbi:MAG: hypothetical protein KGN37_06960 [Burkholderiales bacterium]|nr:hypothetical protein [Burkholderiales bacterium]